MDTVKEELQPVRIVTVFVSPCTRRNCLTWFLLISALLCMLSRGYNLAVIRQNISCMYCTFNSWWIPTKFVFVTWTSSSRCLSIRDTLWIYQFRLVKKLAAVLTFERGLYSLSLMLLLLFRAFCFFFGPSRKSILCKATIQMLRLYYSRPQ